MKRLYFVIIILTLNCGTGTNDSKERTETLIKCSFLAGVVGRETYIPNNKEALENSVRMVALTTVICNDYLNKKDEDRLEVK